MKQIIKSDRALVSATLGFYVVPRFVNHTALLMTVLLTIAVTVFVGTAHAGTIYLREGNNATQDVVGVLTDLSDAAINFTKVRGFTNDEARSLNMEWVAPGTTLRLFDNSGGSRDDDWAEIVVKEWAPMIVVNSFNYSSDNPFVKVAYHAARPSWWRRENGLDGKVSRAELAKSQMMDTMERSTIMGMYLKWEARFGGFPHKGGRALEYSSNGSEYRIYRPDISPSGEGYLISFKLDHIRGGAKDDHAIISSTLDAGGKVVNIGTTVLQGNNMWFRVFVDAFSEIPEQYKANKYAAISEAGAKIAEKVYQALLDLGEAGGREIFTQQIQHKINEVLFDANEAIDAGPLTLRRGQVPVQ
ncbi:MAG: hypothetical protein ACREYC_06780 [Gammaproteobacteria bacterium]